MAELDADDLRLESEEPKPAGLLPSSPPAGGRLGRDGPESLAALSVLIGWGLAVLGLLAAILAWLALFPSAETATPAAQLGRVVRVSGPFLAFAFAGWASFSLLRLTARLLRDRLERDSQRSRELETELKRAIRLLERIAEAVEQRGEIGGLEAPADLARAHALAEFEAALHGGQWALAESLLDTFETTYQGDPKVSSLRAGLNSARRRSLEDRMAELAAARAVNDPARVLELYRFVEPELEREPRQSLRSDVAQWFLTLIYRRLRTGKIQTDVVALAARFADSFAATTEGASVLAALPTLRRSAGLCPRCAQPYTGIDQACPECLRPAGKVVAPSVPTTDPISPE